MTGYDRRKYIAKLMYIFLLGYEVDFGHLEALKLLADIKVGHILQNFQDVVFLGCFFDFLISFLGSNSVTCSCHCFFTNRTKWFRWSFSLFWKISSKPFGLVIVFF